MDYLSPEEARQAAAKAAKVCDRLEKQLSDEPREVVFTALQMLLPVYAANMGMTFEELMTSIAMNLPTFWQNLAAAVSNKSVIEAPEGTDKEKH